MILGTRQLVVVISLRTFRCELFVAVKFVAATIRSHDNSVPCFSLPRHFVAELFVAATFRCQYTITTDFTSLRQNVLFVSNMFEIRRHDFIFSNCLKHFERFQTFRHVLKNMFQSIQHFLNTLNAFQTIQKMNTLKAIGLP